MAITPNGKAIECHHKASYPDDIWYMIPRADKENLINMRRNHQSHNNNSTNNTVISELSQGTPIFNPIVPMNNQAYNHQIPYQVSQASSQPPLPPPPSLAPRNRPEPSQVSFMGGRNEQASLRSRNPNNNN